MSLLALMSYFGGKAKLANKIEDWIDYIGIDTFVDGFTGSASITLNKPEHKINVCNDLNIMIFMVLRALSRKDTADELIQRMFDTEYSEEYFKLAFKEWKQYDKKFKSFLEEMLKLTEYSPELFEVANNKWKTIIPEEKEMQMAVYALVLLKQSFNGLAKRWKGIKDGDEANIYYENIQNLRDIAEKLEGAEVYNVNTLMLINRFRDRGDVFFYLDPPYEMSTRGKKQIKTKKDYAVEMPDNVQLKFIETVRDAKCKMLISGYKREGKSIYDCLERDERWKCLMLEEVSKSSAVGGTGDSKPIDEEYIWYNF